MKVAKETGHSLLELLISLAISSFLVVTLSSYYLGMKRQFLNFEERLSMEMDLFMITKLLRVKIRNAGFTPCASFNAMITTLKAIQSLDDGFMVERMSKPYTEIKIFVDDHRVILKEDLNIDFKKTIVIADCFQAEEAQIQSKKGAFIVLTKALKNKYEPPVYIAPLLREAFFVKKNHGGAKALFYQNQKKEQLSDLITHLALDKKNNLILTLKNGENRYLTTKLRN